MTTTTPPELVVIELDPAAVAVDPKNARRKLDGIAGLAESFRQVGQLVPVLVADVGDGTYRLVAGHRRRAAAEKAGTLLRAVVHDGGERGAALAALVENDARENLTVAERGDAIQRVLDLGVTEADVVKAAGVKAAEVQALRTIHGSKAARAAAAKHPELNLEHAAALAEFDGDPTTVEALTESALEDPGYFEHRLAQARRDKAEREECEKNLAVFREAGVPILDAEAQCSAVAIALLGDGKGKRLTAKGHKTCPGNAAGMHAPPWGKAQVQVFCTDPDGNGHTRLAQARASSTRTVPEPSEEERAKASEERKAVLRNNRELATANGVRLAYVTKLVAGRKAIPGLAGFVAAQILGGHLGISLHDNRLSIDLWEQISGRKAGKAGWKPTPAPAILAAAKNDRDHLVAILTLIAAYHESTTDKTAWRHAHAGRAGYLKFLESTGYALTEQEKMIVAEGAKDR